MQAIDFSAEQNALVTASRDKTITWWDSKSWKIRKVVPAFELIEAAGKPMVFVINRVKPRVRLTNQAVIALSQHGRVAPVMVPPMTMPPRATR